MRLFIFFPLLCFFQYAVADTLFMTNGDQISGTIKSMQENKLILSSPYAELKIPWADIKNIKSTDAHVIEFSDTSQIKGNLIKTPTGVSISSSHLITPMAVQMNRITAINPPVVSDDLKVTGDIHVGGSKASGNTDTQAIHADVKLVTQWANNKLIALAEYNQAANNDTESSNNFHALGQYDRYFSPQWYGFLYADYTKDRFQDLNYRTAFGAGIGYEFFKTTLSFLSTEVGVAYTIEDYNTTEDKEFISGKWTIDYHYWVFDDRLQFFHNHKGLISLEQFDDVLVRSSTGFKYPVYEGLDLLTQFDLDYDNKPAEGKKSTDTRYIVGIGYNW